MPGRKNPPNCNCRYEHPSDPTCPALRSLPRRRSEVVKQIREGKTNEEIRYAPEDVKVTQEMSDSLRTLAIHETAVSKDKLGLYNDIIRIVVAHKEAVEGAIARSSPGNAALLLERLMALEALPEAARPGTADAIMGLSRLAEELS